MNEGGFWNTLSKKMGKDWKVQRIENLFDAGIPDIYFTTTDKGTMGWIELKYAHDWPKRKTTPMKFEHFTPEQKNWIREHGSVGGNIFVFIQVKRDYLLFDWTAHSFLGTVPKSELFDRCLYYWKNQIKKEELLRILNGLQKWR